MTIKRIHSVADASILERLAQSLRAAPRRTVANDGLEGDCCVVMSDELALELATVLEEISQRMKADR